MPLDGLLNLSSVFGENWYFVFGKFIQLYLYTSAMNQNKNNRYSVCHDGQHEINHILAVFMTKVFLLNHLRDIGQGKKVHEKISNNQ